MELNEKIAARRRELALETEKAKREEDERATAAARRAAAEVAEKKQREAEALDAAVKRTLSEQKVDGMANPDPSKKQVDAAVQELLKSATDRMTTGENMVFYILVVSAVLSLLVAWWLVVIFVVLIAVFMNKMAEKYQKQVIDETVNARDHARNLDAASK